MAERHTAVHTAGTLLLQIRVRQMEVEFVPIVDAIDRINIGRQFAEKFDKSCGFSHGVLRCELNKLGFMLPQNWGPGGGLTPTNPRDILGILLKRGAHRFIAAEARRQGTA